jgi:hypothetical protein
MNDCDSLNLGAFATFAPMLMGKQNLKFQLKTRGIPISSLGYVNRKMTVL